MSGEAWRGLLSGEAGRLAESLSPEQARRLEERLRGLDASAAAPSPVVPRRDPSAPAPLSPAQERLWFVDRLEPGNEAYHLQLARRLRGSLDRAALERALGEVVRRQESLRTRFPTEPDGRPVQVVEPPGTFRLPLEGSAGLPEARARAAEEAARPFDLARGPLVRARLLRLAPDDHVLLLTLHHAVADGWSLSLLTRELALLYAAFSRGLDSPLSEPALRYADYASWQRDEGAPAGQLAYWRERLAELPTLELPTDRPRPAGPTARGASYGFALGRELSAALLRVAGGAGVTPFMAALAAFGVLLGRFSGQEDVVVGSPVAGRTRPELEDLVGLFVNMLVLRLDLRGDPTFVELLGRARETSLGAFANQDVPFERLVSELAPERVPSRQPLFQVSFTLEREGEGGDLVLDGLESAPLELELTATQLDLELFVVERPEGLEGHFVYARELFHETTVARLAEHLRTIAAAVVSAPETPLSKLDLLPPAERRLVLERWNDTEAPLPEETVLRAFERLARERPDAPALVSGSGTLSYGDLDRRANRLAHALSGLGAGPESLVALRLDRGPELACAQLAVWKAGAAFLPLDPDWPQERVEVILRDSGAALLVDATWLAGLPEGPDARPLVHPHPQSLAYVIYTSGSSGLPKGVAVEHEGLANLARAQAEAFGITPQSRVLQFASPSFDASVWELVMALANGGALCTPEPDERLSGRGLARALRRLGVTIATLPPPLAAELEPGELALDTLVVAGERCPLELAERFAGGPPAFTNAYGPTESTVCASLVTGYRPDGAAASVPIGRPLRNTRLYVLDRRLTPVPRGAAGELCIAGAGLARGYLGRPAATAERFVPDPFGPPGSRLYRSGDLARHGSDGRLEFLGRLDEQVKIRGYRVEPGEVEAALRRHPGVAEAAVLAREGALHAYVVGRPDPPPPEELRAFLRRTLPDFLVPSSFVPLEELPRLASGKLDRRALPEPAPAPAGAGPRSPAEELLCALWAELLDLERVGAEDNFFDLGGHSLLGSRMLARAGAAFGVELPVSLVFDSPTVRGLAEAVESLRREGAAAPPALAAAPRGGDLPLSFAQERLWFLDQLDPDSPAYVIPLALRLEGELDHGALGAALTEITRRHESLRTSFPAEDGRPRQRIAPPVPVPVALADLSPLAPAKREAEALRRAAEDAARPFDLERGPLLRASLLRLDEREHVLLLAVHHVASDGWSMGILADELGALYEAFAAGRPSPLEELPVQYADVAVWQRAWLEGGPLDAQLAYWKQELDGLSTLELPTARPRPPAQTSAGAELAFTLPREVRDGVEALARAEAATPFMVLLAAFQALLGRYSGQDDVPVGSPIAGRGRPELESLIGFFVNTLVLRGDLSGDPSFRELLARTRTKALAAYVNQDLPFELLVAELDPERDLSRHPLFQVGFALQNAPLGRLELESVVVSGLEVEATSTHVDLELHLLEGDDGLLHGGFVFNTDLFDREAVERMTAHFETLLRSLLAAPETPLSELELLPEEERRLLVETWNETAAPFPAEQVPAALFEAQAAASPEATALQAGDERLSYRELDRRANRLAHRLAAAGAGPERLVGLELRKSVELVVAVLAVWKAGAAFLPLDPDYPDERIAFMRADSGAELVVSPEWLAAGGETWPETAPPARARPDNLAYVVYTSGSTGRPKGVAVAARGVCNLAVSQAEAFGITAGSRVLQFASPSFDAFVSELTTALCSGATLVVPGDDPVAELEERAITTVTLPPSLLARLEPRPLPTLRTLVAAGEDCPAAVVERWSAGRRFLNAYGPSEATVCASIARCTPADGKPPLGRPLANTRLYVLDRRLRPAPRGLPGELCIGGAGLARGYLGRPAATAERFVPDPFGPPGSRLYRSGDLARHRPDGRLEFLGRLDEQVQVRGFRVEPGEVEAALARHPQVAEATAVEREGRLHAYVVPGGEPPADAELRAFLRRSLPEFMLPASFTRLEGLPLTASGKVDRRALPAPAAPPAADGVAPRTPAEELLCRVWAELLGLERVGIDDNFFALGGDSILSIQVVARARRAGLELTPKQLFQHQTVAELAAAAGRVAAVEAPQGPVTGELPLTPIQRWFVESGLPLDHFNQSLLLRVPPDLDEPLAGEIVAALLRHHDALRLRLRRDEDGWRQEIAATAEPPRCPLVDLSDRPEALAEACGELQAGLDVAAGRPVAAGLFDLGPREGRRLLLAIHHLAVDLVSWTTLLEDAEAAYRARRRGLPVELPPKTSPYTAWAKRLAAYAHSEECLRELDFWLGEAAAPAAPLPRDRPGGASTFGSRAEVEVTLSPEETEALLRDVHRAYRTEMPDVLLTGLAQAVHRWSGAGAVRIDVEGHGREPLFPDVDLGRTVGWFTSVYPVRLELPDPEDPGSSLRTVKEALRAVPRRGVGYGVLRYLATDPRARTLARVPPPEIGFNYAGRLEPGGGERLFAPAPEPRGAEIAPEGVRPHLLEVSGGVERGALRLALSYSRNVHDRETVARLAEAYGAALRSLIAHCLAPEAGGLTPSDFPLAGLDQRALDRIVERAGHSR